MMAFRRQLIDDLGGFDTTLVCTSDQWLVFEAIHHCEPEAVVMSEAAVVNFFPPSTVDGLLDMEARWQINSAKMVHLNNHLLRVAEYRAELARRVHYGTFAAEDDILLAMAVDGIPAREFDATFIHYPTKLAFHVATRDSDPRGFWDPLPRTLVEPAG
jgi:hypothetical protein